MAIIGRILGSTVGFAIGGPIGAIAGLALGYVADKRSRRSGNTEALSAVSGRSDHSKDNVQAAFMIAFVTLAAKLCKADGRVTRDEINALKRVMEIPDYAVGEVSAIFDAAKRDASGFEPYARQISGIVGSDPAMIEHILAGLVQIAAADGIYHHGEQSFINSVAREFGLSVDQLRRIESTYIQRPAAVGPDPYEVLGVSRSASDDDIRKAYRKIIKEFHPDRLESMGLPEEFRRLGTKKTAEANVAYGKIKKERKTSRTGAGGTKSDGRGRGG